MAFSGTKSVRLSQKRSPLEDFSFPTGIDRPPPPSPPIRAAVHQSPHDHSNHRHHHGHGVPLEQVDRSMAIGVALNVVFVVAELSCGFFADSLALIADAGHNASDVIGLLLAWAASYLARRPPTLRYTFGFRRSTIYAALGNAVLLLTACGVILWEAVHRLQTPPDVEGPLMIGVAIVGVVINTLTALLFVRGQHDANIRGAFLHMAADAAMSAGVAIAGIAILLTGWNPIDPLVSIMITLVIVLGTWDLFRESLDLALDAVPRGIDPEAIHRALTTIAGVTEVHDLHLWGTSTSETVLTAHLVVPAASGPSIVAEAAAMLRKSYGISHTTLQIEDQRAAVDCPQRPAARSE
jgi:cobalt-zinc-cadmium efflux system protein